MIEYINNTPENSGLGDTLKISFDKVNSNFQFLSSSYANTGSIALLENQINTLSSSLSNYSLVNHTHVISDIQDLQNTLNSLLPTSIFNGAIININTALTNINQNLLQVNTELDNKQNINIVVSSSFTASLGNEYNSVSDLTISNPSPVEGKEYIVNVINGTTTIGGVNYTSGNRVFRYFHSGGWNTFVYSTSKWSGIDDVNSGNGVTGVTIETLDKVYHLTPNTLTNGHLDFSIYSIRETGASLAHQVVVRVNNVNNFATATEIFRSTTGGNFSPHLRSQRKFTLKNNLIRNINITSTTDLGASGTGISVPFNLSGDLYIFFSTIPGATNQVIKYDSIQIKQL
jgi:hypothetical protein